MTKTRRDGGLEGWRTSEGALVTRTLLAWDGMEQIMHSHTCLDLESFVFHSLKPVTFQNVLLHPTRKSHPTEAFGSQQWQLQLHRTANRLHFQEWQGLYPHHDALGIC